MNDKTLTVTVPEPKIEIPSMALDEALDIYGTLVGATTIKLSSGKTVTMPAVVNPAALARAIFAVYIGWRGADSITWRGGRCSRNEVIVALCERIVEVVER